MVSAHPTCCARLLQSYLTWRFNKKDPLTAPTPDIMQLSTLTPLWTGLTQLLIGLSKHTVGQDHTT